MSSLKNQFNNSRGILDSIKQILTNDVYRYEWIFNGTIQDIISLDRFVPVATRKADKSIIDIDDGLEDFVAELTIEGNYVILRIPSPSVYAYTWTSFRKMFKTEHPIFVPVSHNINIGNINTDILYNGIGFNNTYKNLYNAYNKVDDLDGTFQEKLIYFLQEEYINSPNHGGLFTLDKDIKEFELYVLQYKKDYEPTPEEWGQFI